MDETRQKNEAHGPEAREEAARETDEYASGREEVVDQSLSLATDGQESASFPVVGIGASAGGLAAFQSFLSNTPSDSGLAFVLVQHLSPDHESALPEIARRHTDMTVSEVEDGMDVYPNHVYIIPPGKDLAIMDRRLHLMEPPDQRGPRLSIDYFFRSLARDQDERAICVILSGTGSDGAVGLKAVKEAGGMAMIQDPESAEHDAMPRSAYDTGLVDYVLPPEDMGQQLVSYVEHAFGPPGKKVSVPSAEPSTSLQKIFILLRNQVGHDFSHYKKSSIRRRIARRMAVNQIGGLDQYVRYLQDNPEEVDQLFRELLISVTNFFRDPEAFAAVEEKVVPRLLQEPVDAPIRIWVPGCATGEEAYSIAILLREHMERVKKTFVVQIFATDIDGEAIATARAGLYPNGIAADVSPERLDRFFSRENSAFRVNKTIRDMLIFADQNVIGDPPFSNIDFISCRNLLIYMDSELQRKVLSLFHYSLRPDGFLFLGTSETIGAFDDLFETVDQEQRIFRRKQGMAERTPPIAFPSLSFTGTMTGGDAAQTIERKGEDAVRSMAERALLDRYAPPSAIVSRSGRVLYFHGRTGQYLEPPPGKATLHIQRMAREGLRLPLSAALRRAKSEQKPVRYRGIEVKTNGEPRTIDLTVMPVEGTTDMRGLFLVSFEDVTPEEKDETEEASETPGDEGSRVQQLEQELRAKEERLQTTIEELETSNEELQSSNEELQSSNEELQSANEELETSQEELRSVNEELRTTNAELEEKMEQLKKANDDIKNMLTGTGVGTVFLDEKLHVRRFTPGATEVLNLIDGDVGRPIDHVSSTLADYDRLAEDAQHVLDTLEPLEREVQTEAGEWYLLRFLPYRTEQHVVEGVVMTLVDVTSLKQAEHHVAQLKETKLEMAAAGDYAQHVGETGREPLVILDTDLRVVAANHAFYQILQTEQGKAEDVSLFDLGAGQWDTPELRELLEETLPQETALSGYEVTQDLPDIGERKMLLNARELWRSEGEERLILLTFADISET